jgi:hypothetical protein
MILELTGAWINRVAIVSFGFFLQSSDQKMMTSQISLRAKTIKW